MQYIIKKKVLCSAEKGSVIWAEPISSAEPNVRSVTIWMAVELLRETRPDSVMSKLFERLCQIIVASSENLTNKNQENCKKSLEMKLENTYSIILTRVKAKKHIKKVSLPHIWPFLFFPRRRTIRQLISSDPKAEILPHAQRPNCWTQDNQYSGRYIKTHRASTKDKQNILYCSQRYERLSCPYSKKLSWDP